MQLQFEKKSYECLRLLSCEHQYEELTQEVRLPDSMPDIGKVLCGWGQALLRGKEWRGSYASASGGAMVWILYLPEDGSEPRSVETWIPFQMKWEVPDSKRDGLFQVSCHIQAVDGRSLSARKLMVRVGVCGSAQIMEPAQMELYQPSELPDDIQLLQNDYPLCIPKEAGEKMFALEEEITVPASCPHADKLIRYSLQPEIIDCKVIGDKVVFRGCGILHMLLRCEDGRLHSCDVDVPFSQYAQLEGEFSPDAQAKLQCAVTGMEADLTEEGTVRLKAGLTGQYVVYDKTVIPLIQDAYSVSREVTPVFGKLDMPLVLDDLRENHRAQWTMDGKLGEQADVHFFMDKPEQRWNGDRVAIEQNGSFQILYYDEEGTLQIDSGKTENQWDLALDPQGRVFVHVIPSGKPQLSISPGSGMLAAEFVTQAVCLGDHGIRMVQELEIGEAGEKPEHTPSLILCRLGEKSLWQLAKECKTTMEAIRHANGLEGEPDSKRLLLIPYL